MANREQLPANEGLHENQSELLGGPQTTDRHAAMEVAQIDRLANLVDCGEVPFPAGLCRADRRRLWEQVSHLRRLRLVTYFARAIAQDIHHANGR